jgi:hypothetical protein
MFSCRTIDYCKTNVLCTDDFLGGIKLNNGTLLMPLSIIYFSFCGAEDKPSFDKEFYGGVTVISGEAKKHQCALCWT